MHDAEFAGRMIADPGFAGDDGEADPRLAGALEAYAADPARSPEVIFALASSRVLVPIVAVPRETGTVGGLAHDKSSDMALVTVVGRDGRRALPVFSSVAALAAWRVDARPVPVEAQRSTLLRRAATRC